MAPIANECAAGALEQGRVVLNRLGRTRAGQPCGLDVLLLILGANDVGRSQPHPCDPHTATW
jgi:hypothetical protein